MSRVAGGYDYGVAPTYGGRVSRTRRRSTTTEERRMARMSFTSRAARAAAKAAAAEVIARQEGGFARHSSPGSVGDGVNARVGGAHAGAEATAERTGRDSFALVGDGDGDEPGISTSPGSALRAPRESVGALPPKGAGTVREGTGRRSRTSTPKRSLGVEHVESSLQREFDELREEYSSLVEQASRGRVAGNLADKLEDVIGRLEAKSAQIAGFQCIPFDR